MGHAVLRVKFVIPLSREQWRQLYILYNENALDNKLKVQRPRFCSATSMHFITNLDNAH